ncbi:Secreted beta-glucosidase sun1 [Penicillium chermesinum]|nr:Secreted beta-glucosidase sun1 [Penicillium chermesinum]
MKYALVLSLASASMVVAHGHGHAKFHQRAVETEVKTVAVPGPAAYEFVVIDPEQNGKPEALSQEKACAGLASHEFEWLGTAVPLACPTSTATPSPTTTVKPQVLLEQTAAISTSSSSSSSSTSTSTSIPTSTSTSTSIKSAPTHSSSSSSNTGAIGLTAEFPDVPLDYLGLGGWSGVQYVSIVDALVSSITTAVSGEGCTDGAMCSYACPAGYQKAQWPKTQGSTGQSVGGLECKNGKLYLTNPTLSKTLCIEGTGGVTVKNHMSEDVAICRTDYPGTESETIPLKATANGGIHPLTCPNSAEYFVWQGKPTSAQYYVNNKGVSIEKGCQWGDGSEPIGNWAPLNIGVGYSAGATWISMLKNEPTTDADLDFAVGITGDGVTAACMYDGKGNFYNSDGRITSGNGCTTSFPPGGSAQYVFAETFEELKKLM